MSGHPLHDPGRAPGVGGPYNATVLDHFEHPRNVGALPDADFIVEASNPVCGDRMRLFVRVEDDRILRATFQTQGCPAAIAASSMTTLMLAGKTRLQIEHIGNEDVARALGGLPRSKVHCSVLAEEVIRELRTRW